MLRIGIDIRPQLDVERELRSREETLRALSARLITAQEDQNRHIARELHDVFGQRMAAAAIDVSRLVGELPHDDDTRATLHRVGEELRELADALHHTGRELHPRILDDLGLAATLRNECAVFEKRGGLPVRLRARNVPDKLPRDVALSLYRIAQEALRNAVTHASATRIEVTLAVTRGRLGLRVHDDGDGFEEGSAALDHGLGLASMRERAALIGGTLDLTSARGQGTAVEAQVPLTESAR